MLKNACFKFTDDIFFLEDKLPFNKTQYVIGSPHKESYVSVSEKQFEVLRCIYEVTQAEELNMDELVEVLQHRYKLSVNPEALYQNFAKRGLIKDSENTVGNSEINLISTKVFEYHCTGIHRRILTSIQFISKITPIFKPLTVLLFVLFLLNISEVITLIREHLFVYDHSTSKGLLMGMIVSLVTIFIHEIAHIMVAIGQGLTNFKFYMVLYAKFIPMYYTKYTHLMKLNYRSKIKILSAGIKSNVFIIGLSLAALAVLPLSDLAMDIIVKFILVNTYFVLLNCSPFITNDGYFILRIVMGIDALRLNLWRYVIGWFKKDRSIKPTMNNSFLVKLYMVISALFFLGSLLSMVLWLKQGIAEIIQIII